MTPPAEPVKVPSILDKVADYLSGRKSEATADAAETEAVEMAEVESLEETVARTLIETPEVETAETTDEVAVAHDYNAAAAAAETVTSPRQTESFIGMIVASLTPRKGSPSVIEEPQAEEPQAEEAAAEEAAAEEAAAEVPPPAEAVKSSSFLDKVGDCISGRNSETTVEAAETETVETAEAESPMAEAESPVAEEALAEDASPEAAPETAPEPDEAVVAEAAAPSVAPDEEKPTLLQQLSKAFSSILPKV